MRVKFMFPALLLQILSVHFINQQEEGMLPFNVNIYHGIKHMQSEIYSSSAHAHNVYTIVEYRHINILVQ